jgi:cytochrome c peroxidase
MRNPVNFRSRMQLLPFYNPIAAGLDVDLTYRQSPTEPVLARVDSLLAAPIERSADEVNHLIAFVRDGLLDERATKQNLCRLVPQTVPSGFPTMRFETCPQ